MEIRIKETNEIVELEIIDPKTNLDFIADFIGNTGSLHDGQFEYDEDTEIYTTTQENYDWWETVVTDNQELENRLFELRQEHGNEAVHNAIGESGNCDLEKLAVRLNQNLDEVFKGE